MDTPHFVRFARTLALLSPLAAAAPLASGCNTVARADPPPANTQVCPGAAPTTGQACGLPHGRLCTYNDTGYSQDGCRCVHTPPTAAAGAWECQRHVRAVPGPLSPPDLPHAQLVS